MSTLVACAPAAPERGVDTDARIAIAEGVEPDTLDPIGSSLYVVDSIVWSTVYETLVTTTVDGAIEPVLATDWKLSDDGLTYTFSLREGVTFHDGNDFTAEDVVYSLERAKTEGIPLIAQRLEPITSITAVDDLTVDITIAAPDSTFIYTLADPSGIGVSILDSEADDPAAHPVGTGPFVFDDYSPAQSITLVRNDDYWDPDELPAFRTLDIRFIEEDQSQLAALNAGDVKLILPKDASTLQQARSDGALEVETYPGAGYWINFSRIGITQNPDVVRAIALSIDRQALVDGAFLGEAVPGSTAHPLLSFGLGPDDLPNHQRDVTLAKEVLAKAGFPDGIELTATYSTQAFSNTFFEILQASLADAGITLDLEPVEQQVWASRFLQADYDLSATTQAWYANPLRYVLPRVGWQAPPEEIAPELPALLDAFGAAKSDDDRAAAFQAIQEFQANVVYPFIGTVWTNQAAIYRAGTLQAIDADALAIGARRDFYLSIKP
nr:ABC transporter substrate-binding protein [Microbacterium ulmi]